MGKISDIWVRLGLKKSEYDKGMDEAGKKAESFGTKMKNMAAGAKAAWAMVGAAVVAFSREMILATNKVGDAWNATMGAMKNAWQQLLANISNTNIKDIFKGIASLATKDVIGSAKFFKNLFGGTKEAAEAGKEMAKAFDAEFELVNSLKIQRANISGMLADLRVEMANVNLSPEQRKAAAAKYEELLRPLYEAEIATRTDMLNKAIDAWMAGQNINASRQDVIDYFTNVGTDAAGAAARHPELANVFTNRKGDRANQVIFDAITNLATAENGLARELKEVRTLANSLDKSNKEALLSIDDLINSVEDIDLADMEAIEPMDWDAILGDYDAELDSFVDKWRATQEKLAQYNQMIEDSIISAMGNGLQAITDMMFGLEGADMRGVLAAFIAPFGDMMKNLGALIMEGGIAASALKNLIKDPTVAIAAGAALMALGSMVSSGVQRMVSTGSGSGSVATTGASSAETETIKTELTVYVEGKISGKDIVLAGNNTRNSWRR